MRGTVMPMLEERAARAFLEDTTPSIHQFADAARAAGEVVDYLHPVRQEQQLRDLRDEVRALNRRRLVLNMRPWRMALPEEKRLVGMYARTAIIHEWWAYKHAPNAIRLLQEAADLGEMVGTVVAIRADRPVDIPPSIRWIEAEPAKG